MYQKLSR
ncbi:hypothetical protein B4U80_06338 [Leptotrombidium deliense]|nr:hypothetical protein B4U80_06338 [Leptotrombidium deliense]